MFQIAQNTLTGRPESRRLARGDGVKEGQADGAAVQPRVEDRAHLLRDVLRRPEESGRCRLLTVIIRERECLYLCFFSNSELEHVRTDFSNV